MKEIKKAVKAANKRVISNKEASDLLDKFNEMLDGHGVEPMRKNGYFDRHFGDARLLYVNMGDSYIQTVFLDTDKNHFFIDDVATAVERYGL